MKRVYIGLAMSYHEPSISFVNEKGEVLFAEATERYMQNKRAFNCVPDDMILVDNLVMEFCKGYDDFVIAYSWHNDRLEYLEENWRTLEEDFNKANKFTGIPATIKGLVANYIIAGENTNLQLLYNNGDVKIVRKYFYHHDTHAANACYGSPFDNALCAVVDGYGETASSKYFKFENNRLTELDLEHDSAASLGVFYSLICTVCGFDAVKGEEWKVMGLAPYGKMDKNFYDMLDQCVFVDGVSIKFRVTNDQMTQKLLDMRRLPQEPSLKAADWAYTGQAFFADAMTKILNNLYNFYPSDNLILTGGCGLNSSFNGQILEKTKFKHLYLPSAPADDGNSTGAALLAFYEDNPDFQRRKGIQLPYLGHTAKKTKLEQAVELGGMKNALKPGEDICVRAAELLADGKVIGWFQGRAEMGPRALGNRSILADPRSAEVKEKINARVKFREEYRPFAPSILHEYGSEYFENYQESPYMERTLKFKEEVYEKVPGVVHVDGTGRLQTVKKEWNDKYHKLISEFHKLTGVPILLNTSFNVMGKPIVHSVEDAIAVFYTSGLDALVIEDKLFIK